MKQLTCIWKWCLLVWNFQIPLQMYNFFMDLILDILFACMIAQIVCYFITSLFLCWFFFFKYYQFSSVDQLCPTLCDPMNGRTPGLPVHHQLPEFTETHVHQVSDAIQPSHPLSSPFTPAPNPSQHQSLFQWVNSSHEVAKVLEFQL